MPSRKALTLFFFLPLAIGLSVPTVALAIDLHPTGLLPVDDACHHIVNTTRTYLVRHKYSRVVIARWEQWGKGHPEWVKRHQHDKPKMEVRTEDGTALIAAYCPVSVNNDISGLLTPSPPPELTAAFMTEVAPPVLVPPAPNDTPGTPVPETPDKPVLTSYAPDVPPVFFGPIGGGLGAPPLVSIPPVIPPVPEPGTLPLMLTGCVATWFSTYRNKRKSRESPNT